jgi:hypothetical protein
MQSTRASGRVNKKQWEKLMKNMPAISIILGVIALFSASAQAQVDIRDRIKNQASRVIESVDNSTATESELQQILQQLRQINLTLGSPNGGGNDLFCEPRSSSYSYVTRSRDGLRFGEDVLNDQCQRMIVNSKNGLVCGPRSSSYAKIYNIATGAVIGEDVLNDNCISLVAASNRQLVCGPRSSSYAHVYRISDAVTLGEDVLQDQCKQVVANATAQLVCAPRSSSYAYITRIATGETIGSDILFNDCYQRIRQ